MIIKTLLDNDLYKFTMLQTFLHYEEKTLSKYEFRCRTQNIDFSPIFDEINDQIDSLCSLRFTEDELEYLSTLPFIREPFIKFLRAFKFNRKFITTSLDTNDQLRIVLAGPIVSVSLFEVPILSIVSELYSKKTIPPEKAAIEGDKRLDSKIHFLQSSLEEIPFIDFGTRRRYSFDWQYHVIERLISSKIKGLVGTSNVSLAKKHGITPVGTMAHEWIMAHAGVTDFRESNKLALKRWLEFYHGDLGIALTDTYTTDSFLSDFDKNLSARYAGLRHDSGDWKEWGEKILHHYEKFGIDPHKKKLIYSDSLNFDLISTINKEFKDKASLLYGIGTNLTNDVGFFPLQIVIKMVECNGKPLIKISDDEGKILCNDEKFKKKAMEYFKGKHLTN